MRSQLGQKGWLGRPLPQHLNPTPDIGRAKPSRGVGLAWLEVIPGRLASELPGLAWLERLDRPEDLIFPNIIHNFLGGRG